MYQANYHSPARVQECSCRYQHDNPEEQRNLCVPPLHRITLHKEVIEAVIIPCDCSALSSEQPGMLQKGAGVIILPLRGKAQTGICLKFPQGGINGTWE